MGRRRVWGPPVKKRMRIRSISIEIEGDDPAQLAGAVAALMLGALNAGAESVTCDPPLPAKTVPAKRPRRPR